MAENNRMQNDTSGANTGEPEADGNHTVARTTRRILPLNSRHLTTGLLRQFAGGLGVPETTAHSNMLTLIEGKLRNSDRDPLHTQVVLLEVERGTQINLQDDMGV